MHKPNKYYAYLLTDKNRSGIVENWKECEKIVSGKDARYKSFASKTDAENWLKNGANYEIKPPKALKKLEKGIYFDSGTGRDQRVEVSVTDESGKDLLEKIIPKIKINKFGKHPVPKATNNYGELLACKFALKLALKFGIKHIFGDSKLVLDYWSKGFIKKDLPKKTQKLSTETSELRNAFENNGGKIEFIEGDYNPADLGFHR
ncbi:MAG: ribonuclease H family protein [Patescibacteria group bacterium]|nr:ribonuclease H family protein [Patescibacteria group bacterium]